MLRFLRKVLRKFQTANTTRTPRRAHRPARLGLEGLEDRMLLSAATAKIIPGTDTLSVTGVQLGEQITFKVDHLKHSQLDVFDGTTKIGHFPIASIQNVDVILTAFDSVIVNDSNGYTFATGTTISLSGSAPGNSLTLTGSRTLKAEEIYLPGTDAGTGQLRLLDPTSGQSISTYNLDATISSMNDSIKTTGLFDVQTSSGNVSLSGANGVTQTLSGLAINGSAINNLTFSNKAAVQLEEYAANATVNLTDTTREAGEKSFTLLLIGAGDVANFAAAPVTTNVNVSGDACFVNLGANTAPVTINGDGTTSVSLENTSGTTKGIQANVNVQNAQQLVVIDLDNNTTQENVNVTESTISGTGLFGNNSVVVTYSLDKTPSGLGLMFFTSQQADTYTVANSSPNASFSTFVTIVDDSNVGLNTLVTVSGNSDLNLTLLNQNNLPNNDLSITALDGGRFVNPNPHPNLKAGTDFAVFGEISSSQVNFHNLHSLSLNAEVPTVPFDPQDVRTSSSLTPLTQLSGMDKKQDFGHGKGTYTTSAIVSSAPHGYQLTGTGTFLNLGAMQITGSVGTVGGFATGEARGELTFTNAKGSVTIQLIGPEQRGFSALPSTFEFSVEKGTGAYAGMTGFGSLTLKLGPASGHGLKLSGDFSLTINSF